jgi:2-amino-4-hydroxy-6-hydroxymethyldihydropteridine diphosphokinase
MRAFVGLGSNLGERLDFLRDAVRSLDGVVAVSPVYETEPVGGPEGQPPYLNVVVELETSLSPRALLVECWRLERAAGRVRKERWGPRTLDADVLLYGDLAVDDPDLRVPHPRMHERRFVMAPLADVAPDVVPAGWASRVGGAVQRVGTLDGYERHPLRGRNVEG